VATIASRIMPENKVKHLDDGTESNAGEADTNEVRVGGRGGGSWQQAMFCLHFWLTKSWMGMAIRMGTGE
jgi:hypothetical protein